MRKLLLCGAAAVACLPSQALAQQVAPADHGRGGIGEVVVTAAPFAQRRLDILQGTSVLSGEALDRALGPSLGETLDRLPGLSQTAFGQGASRPIIRGLGGDRIRVLTAGIGSIDASTTSPDHAPAIDPATARRIEVVRGPGTLLYGSNAIGGVVNVLDGRVPSDLPEGGADGRARLSFGTNANEKLASAGLDVALAGPLVLHADGFLRHANDYEAPGRLRSRPLREAEPPHEGEEEEKGRVENSAAEGMGATGGLSYVGDWGFIGASVSRLDTKYGIPGGHGHGEEHGEHEEGEEEHDEHEEGEEHDHAHEDVRIDLGQTRIDLIGEVNSPFLAFETTRLRFGWADYEHKELEGEEVGTRFLNDGWEGRVEFVQRQAALMGGNLGGAVGAQALRRDFRAIGDEAFVPPSVTDQWGVFAVERLDFGPFALEGGVRLERQEVTARSQGFDRDFTGLSLSAGLSHEWSQGWLAGFSVSRTERAPNAEELLSDGPHLATGTYEVGDPTLGEETALGVEATVKRTVGPVTGSVNLFYTDYEDFIAELFTGGEEDGLPVARYGAVEARFWGAELEASAEAWRRGDQALLLDAGVDFVRARNRSDDEDLPRIPPLTVRLGAEYVAARWSGRVEVELADDQKRTAGFELPTAGYAVLNAGIDWHPWENRDFSLAIEGRNLTDETVRLSSSFLKDRLPQPGRDVRLILRTAF